MKKQVETFHYAIYIKRNNYLLKYDLNTCRYIDMITRRKPCT